MTTPSNCHGCGKPPTLQIDEDFLSGEQSYVVKCPDQTKCLNAPQTAECPSEDKAWEVWEIVVRARV